METPVLLVSNGFFDPPLLGWLRLRRELTARPGYRFSYASSLEVLPRLSTAALRAIVLHVRPPRLSSTALESLDAFVKQGGGLFALHGAAALDDGSPLGEILGGRMVAHGRAQSLRVRPAVSRGRLFDAVAAFTVRDAVCRFAVEQDVEVHLGVAVGETVEPVVWTRAHGRGRVCYVALGHTAGVMRHPQVRQILNLGLAWTSGNLPAVA